MSYWAWLTRMAFFGLLSGASLLFWFRTTPSSETQSQDDPFAMPQAQVVPFDAAYPLPEANPNYRPAKGQLPPIPKSRLAPLQTYEAYSAGLPNRTSDSANAPTPSATNRLSRSTASSGNPSRSTASSTTAATPPSRPTAPPPFNLNASLPRYFSLFENPISLGMLAIGVAEGNYRVFVENSTLFVEQTSLYFGHTDPGNLSWGQRVTNYGPCSDQGRSGGDISVAEQMCLARSRDRLPTNLQDLANAGINPDTDLEAVINTADLYNQASPVHSRLFPQALKMAYDGGLQGVEAMAWARTASFYVNGNNQLDIQNGRNVASGLLGICAREGRAVTEWECVYGDQLRRARAVASVLDQYFQVYGAQS